MTGGPRRIDQPRPGFFVMRLVRQGWAVPCRIEHDEQTGIWTATIDEVAQSAPNPVDAGVFRIWLHGSEIEDWRYQDMLAAKAWARANAPDHPSLHPRKRIDPMLLRPQDVPRSVIPFKPRKD